MAVPPRFVIFGLACVAWIVAMTVFESPALEAAGRAWFINWGIQIVVSIAFWIHPFAPLKPDRRFGRWSARFARLCGVPCFGKIASRIHPLEFDLHSMAGLQAAMISAEATHRVTCVAVGVIAVAGVASDAIAMAAFLTLWNALFNVYPVVLQRHNLSRVCGVATRLRRRASPPTTADT